MDSKEEGQRHWYDTGNLWGQVKEREIVAFEPKKMRVTRIELAYPAWEADVLPLNYTRLSAYNSISIYTDSRDLSRIKYGPGVSGASFWVLHTGQ